MLLMICNQNPEVKKPSRPAPLRGFGPFGRLTADGRNTVQYRSMIAF
jgi:hypothetical protein